PLETRAPDGTPIAIKSTAEPLVRLDDRRVAQGTVSNRIGVIDFAGRISSVKLEFLRDLDHPPQKIVEPQVISRIWHEELPPAAGPQDKVAFLPGPSPNDPWLAGIEPGPRTFTLPYHCNRAAVLMRGFKLKFLDRGPRKIKQLGCGIEGTGVF